MDNRGRQSVRVDLQDTPGQRVPFEVRLRRWLKGSLRSYGLRCTRLRWPGVKRAKRSA